MNCHGDMKVKHAFGKRSEENEENTENQGKWFLLYMQKKHGFTMSNKCI